MEKKLTNRTRAGDLGLVIRCPKCGDAHGVYHLAWFAGACNGCGEMVEKTEYLLVRRNKLRDQWYCENDEEALDTLLDFSGNKDRRSDDALRQHAQQALVRLQRHGFAPRTRDGERLIIEFSPTFDEVLADLRDAGMRREQELRAVDPTINTEVF